MNQGGTILKKRPTVGNKKSVRWAEKLTETRGVEKNTITSEKAAQIISLVNCLRQQKSFFESPTFKAVSWMYGQSEEMSAKSELAYILLYVKLRCVPTVQTMMATIECEPEMNQQDLIGDIVEACESQGGTLVLESLLGENESLDEHCPSQCGSPAAALIS